MVPALMVLVFTSGAFAADTDCSRADTSDTDVESCDTSAWGDADDTDASDTDTSDTDASDTDATDTGDTDVYIDGSTPGQLLGEEGGPSCDSGAGGNRLGLWAAVGALGALLARRAGR